MEIDEFFNHRKNILAASKDEFGFIQQQGVLAEILPFMLDSKLIESEDSNDSYFINESEKLKVNSYTVNESGERLQLFCINENSINEATDEEELKISQKDYYDNQLKRTIRFLSKTVKGQLNQTTQDSDRANALISKLSSPEGIEQFDVVEIFNISLTATVSFKGAIPQPRRMHFDQSELKVPYISDGIKKTKNILILRRIIDLNFIFNAITSRGDREALTVNFHKTFGYNVEVIKAAEEENFESYLCVLKAEVLFDLYKHYSTRLLEKNVRSFLQFKGVNKGIKETIRNEPEKFIAYNNGLTITAIDANVFQSKKKMYIESLKDFQIVNGGQTTASIYFSKKDGLDISKVKVMAKINVAKESSLEKLDDLIANISKYSNTQSRVSNVDLRARNPQLVKLKSLSDSIITPSGAKWFFERAKGEFNTSVRIAGANSNRIKKEYPNERRFSKEQLAKYYSAWGDQPYLVKKGGEKIFRYFIEQISPTDIDSNVVSIDRDYYEALIAKIILFRKLEKIYGQGKNAMGQLRSAVIPYSLSILYILTDGKNNQKVFDLSRIWKHEGLEDDISEFFRQLMLLVNDLIKKYSISEDYGEYSKKEELWTAISSCREVNDFMESNLSKKIIEKYTIKK